MMTDTTSHLDVWNDSSNILVIFCVFLNKHFKVPYSNNISFGFVRHYTKM